MSKIHNLRDVLVDELKDIYSAENQLLKALPKMEKAASSPSLKEALSKHLVETKQHVKRLDEIGKILEEKLTGKICKAMKGLIEEGSEVVDTECDSESLMDSLIIGAAQRVEHYEIAAYGTARAMAEELGESEVVSLLSETLDEESAADETLSSISVEEILPEACKLESQEDESDSRSARI